MGSGYGSGRLANRGRSGGVRRRSVAVGRRAAGARGARSSSTYANTTHQTKHRESLGAFLLGERRL